MVNKFNIKSIYIKIIKFCNNNINYYLNILMKYTYIRLQSIIIILFTNLNELIILIVFQRIY